MPRDAPPGAWVRIFLPFALGYYLSYLLRTVNAVISPALTDELGLSAAQLGLLAMASVFLAAGYYLIINSMRHGEMSLIAPFRYSGLLFAVVLGYTIWGDVPNLVAWCGIVLLVGSGLYVLYHERQRVRRAAALEVS